MSIRQDRLADEIRDVLAVCFTGGILSDPRLENVTITGVKLSGDLQIASVYFRVIEDDKADEALKALGRANGYFRKKLAGKLEVRRIPEIRFFYDKSVEHGARIEHLLSQIK